MENSLIELPDKDIIDHHKELINEAKRLYDQQISYGTRRVYQSDWKIFQMWCQEKGYNAQNVTSDIIALFLTSQFKSGMSPSTLTRRLAAIKFYFTCQNKASPTDNSIVRSVLKGIRRDKSVQPIKSKKALVVNIIKEIIDLCPAHTLRGIRDKALILIGFSGSYRRSELVAIDIEHLAWQDKGMDILIAKSKTDQEGKGDIKPILKSRDEKYCPILATQAWIKKSQLTSGPLWRAISKGNRVKDTRLSTDGVYLLVKKYISKLGYDETDFSPHSLRSGFITSALEKGAKPSKIMDISKHKSLQTLQKYIKHAERYEDHAGNDLL